MAEITVGSAVLSKAGRDKGRYFAVLSLDNEYAYLADGDLRKLATPKRKKQKHLAVTNTVFAAGEMATDKTLSAAIQSRFAGSRP